MQKVYHNNIHKFCRFCNNKYIYIHTKQYIEMKCSSFIDFEEILSMYLQVLET